MTAEIAEQPVPLVQEADDATSEEAPYGWMTDPGTGERRPKKRPGRRSKTAKAPPGKSPALEELQALGSLTEASEDTAPGAPAKERRKSSAPASLPPFRAGVISKGVNKLYRKAGRVIRMFDYDIGTAVIACTRVTVDEDDGEPDGTTVGDAWEELAKTNPRIRAFILNALQGGAMWAVFTAHLPILMAIAMKDGIRQRIPLLDLATTLLVDDDDDGQEEAVPSGLSQMMGGINPDDMAQMMAMAQGLMGNMAAGVPRMPNMPRGPVAGHPDPAPFPQNPAGMEHPADQG